LLAVDPFLKSREKIPIKGSGFRRTKWKSYEILQSSMEDSTMTFTRDQILEAATYCTTITAVAQRLGCCGAKLSGGTASRLRAICPELDERLKANKEKGSSTVCPVLEKPSPAGVAVEDNPYRPGSTYACIYAVGSTGYMTKAELIAKVATITQKSHRSISFSLCVLCNQNHSSNLKRSTALRDDATGTIKLIALSRPSTK
jgi:hypothetical protein